MKAVRFHEHGGLDVLRQEDVPDPEPGPGEVLIRVRTCALNHLDLWQRRGIPGVRLPHCPGSDVAGEVVRAPAGGVDVVFEHVGQATWEPSMKSLKRGGRLVTCGATTGPSVSMDIRHLFSRQISLIGSYMGSKGELLRAAELFFDGRFTPVVDSSFPLEAAVDAQRRLEDKSQFGKIVLDV